MMKTMRLPQWGGSRRTCEADCRKQRSKTPMLCSICCNQTKIWARRSATTPTEATEDVRGARLSNVQETVLEQFGHSYIKMRNHNMTRMRGKLHRDILIRNDGEPKGSFMRTTSNQNWWLLAWETWDRAVAKADAARDPGSMAALCKRGGGCARPAAIRRRRVRSRGCAHSVPSA